MEWLSPPWRVVVSALFGGYLGYVVIRALQTGQFRYKGRTHPRATDARVFWMGVAWFAVLAIVCFGYAVMVGVELLGGTA